MNRFKGEYGNQNYRIRVRIENGVPPVLLQAIVKSLNRFERQTVIRFYRQHRGCKYGIPPVLFHGMNRLGLGIIINDHFDKLR